MCAVRYVRDTSFTPDCHCVHLAFCVVANGILFFFELLANRTLQHSSNDMQSKKSSHVLLPMICSHIALAYITTLTQVALIPQTPSSRSFPWNRSVSIQEQEIPSVSSVPPVPPVPNEIFLSLEALLASDNFHCPPSTNPLDANTTGGYIPGYEDFCALWNTSCRGDPESAFTRFEQRIEWGNGVCDKQSPFSKNITIDSDVAPLIYWIGCSISEERAPQSSKIAFEEMRAYARSPQCKSMYQRERCPPLSDSGTLNSTCVENIPNSGPCCGDCVIQPAVVDVFYWPVEGADESCLSIVDDISSNRNLEASSYTKSVLLKLSTEHICGTSTTVVPYEYSNHYTRTYWGCTTSSTAMDGSIKYGYLTTAVREDLGNVSYKHHIYDPWETTAPCINTSVNSITLGPQTASATVLQGRDLSNLNFISSAINESHPSNKVVVSNNFTL